MNPTLIALIAFLLYVATAFGLRSWLQFRRTGDTGFRGVSGRPGSLEWLGGVAFIAALAGFLVGMVIDLVEVLPFLHPELGQASVRVTGSVLAAVGIAGCIAAQLRMGDEWRIGVAADERTALVTGGMFRYVRNPIFSFMGMAALGLTLVVPNAVTLISLLLLLLAVELQVRFVEEPYLARVHGADWDRYAAQTGRFVPGVGRTRSMPRAETSRIG